MSDAYWMTRKSISRACLASSTSISATTVRPMSAKTLNPITCIALSNWSSIRIDWYWISWKKIKDVLKELLTTRKSYVNGVWLNRDGERASWNLNDSTVKKYMASAHRFEI